MKPTSVVSKLTIPSSVVVDGIRYRVKTIAANAFKGQKKLRSITISAGVTGIGIKAFYGCKNLKRIQIKTKALKNVGKNAFKGIHAKAKIKVPKAKLRMYKKLLRKKGQGKQVKITK